MTVSNIPGRVLLIECDQEGCTNKGEYAIVLDDAEARQRAIKDGWRMESDNECYCRNHAWKRPKGGINWLIEGPFTGVSGEDEYIVHVISKSESKIIGSFGRHSKDDLRTLVLEIKPLEQTNETIQTRSRIIGELNKCSGNELHNLATRIKRDVLKEDV